MARFFGKLVAVPIRMLAGIFTVVPVFDQTPLWSAAWKLSYDAQDGCNLLVLVCQKHGIEAARQLAEMMLPQSKDCALAATIASLELRSSDDIEVAARWVATAKQSGYKNPELLLYVELVFGDFLEDYDKRAVAEQILSRNDLPSLFTLTALIEKAAGLLERQSWDEAEKIADHILSIQENSEARVTKWVVCRARSDQAQADVHLRNAQGKLSDGVFNVLVARGWLYLGQIDNAMELLYNASQSRICLRESRSPLGRLACSRKFAEFCRSKDST